MKIDDKVRAWFDAGEGEGERRVILTHGGDGGRWYAVRESGIESEHDGVGDTIEDALIDMMSDLEEVEP